MQLALVPLSVFMGAFRTDLCVCTKIKVPKAGFRSDATEETFLVPQRIFQSKDLLS